MGSYFLGNGCLARRDSPLIEINSGCARIKEELLKAFNLHTIVRLPNGVFAPSREPRLETGVRTAEALDRGSVSRKAFAHSEPLRLRTATLRSNSVVTSSREPAAVAGVLFPD